MNFKKRVNGSRTDIPHYIYKTDTDTITTLPAVLYPTGATATVGLKGNTVQSGTPTPDSPVMPQGTGERTGNLLDLAILQNNKGLSASGNVIDQSGRITTVTPINVSGFSETTLTYVGDNVSFIYATFNSGTLVERVAGKESGYTINTANCDVLYICFYGSSSINTDDVSSIMLNLGSTALPYEPFGIKIPILSGGTTTPVYLGEVESTRLVKKLVFDGTENWKLSSTTNQFYMDSVLEAIPFVAPICTHFKGVSSLSADNQMVISATQKINVRTTYIQHNLTDWINYLQQQYTNGTPVCVWYVLAEPTIGIVNEPLHKIGEYADTVSNISIPVAAGGDTLSVGTTVQPSEVTVTYKGWHPVADVHERDNGAWT